MKAAADSRITGSVIMYAFNYFQTATVCRLEVIKAGKIAAIFETKRQGKSRFFRQVRNYLYREYHYRKGTERCF